MRQLNEIMSVLLDPARRVEYDRSLSRPSPEAMVEPPRRLDLARFQVPVFLIVSAILLGSGAYWLFPDSFGRHEFEPVASAGPVESAAQAPAPAARIEPQMEDPVIRPPVRKQVSESGAEQRESALAAAPLEAAEVPPPPAPSPQPVAAAPEETKQATPPAQDKKPPPSRSAPEPPPNQQSPEPPSGSLEGTWLFSPARRATDEKMYPPKYIEMKIFVEDGIMYGRYRGQYEVHDQPISPNVNFSFKGKPTQTKFTWSGPGGSKGDVELKLLTPRTVRVDWKTEETGPGLDLVAGTAVLVRRAEN
jgi:hypothetical protein